jgi:hypothetical protein
MLPATIYGMICGAVVDTADALSTGDTSGDFTGMAMILGIVAIILGIVGAVKGKSSPKVSGICLIISAIIAFIGWWGTAFSSFFHLASLVLFVIGGIVALTQKIND